MTDRLIRITTTLAVMAVAVVAAIISYQHAYELVRSHGESGVTARLLPFTYEARQLISRHPRLTRSKRPKASHHFRETAARKRSATYRKGRVGNH